MERNNGQTIFLSVIGIATLLVAIIGATFAYFSTTLDGQAANVSATTAKIGAVTFTAEGITTDNTAILPGWTSGAKNVTVTYGAADYPVDYNCKLSVTTNGITGLKLTSTGENGVSNEAVTTSANDYVLASGTLAADSTNGSQKSFTYTLSFPETGSDQNGTENANHNATVNATVSCSLSGNTIYYNTNNTSGTTTTPTAY